MTMTDMSFWGNNDSWETEFFTKYNAYKNICII